MRKPEKYVYKYIEYYMWDIFGGGGQNLELWNLERPVFRNFETANIKIKKDEEFDNFIFKLFFSFLRNYLNTWNIK